MKHGSGVDDCRTLARLLPQRFSSFAAAMAGQIHRPPLELASSRDASYDRGMIVPITGIHDNQDLIWCVKKNNRGINAFFVQRGF